MNKLYEHTQIGYLTITSIGATLLFLIYIVVVEFYWISLLVILVLAIALFLFATLKITISDGWLTVRFGIGLIRKNILLKDIQSVQIFNYPWYYGWGLRYSFRGEWVYSVSGFRAIKVITKTGEKYIIGTDEPEALASAIQKAIRQNQ